VVHTSNTSSCQKNVFSFPVPVNNSIKVGSLAFFLQKFVITEKIMKRPVYFIVCLYLVKSVLLKGTFYFSVKQWHNMT
jgi:hypothetical protein